MRIGLGIHVGNRKKASGKKTGQITVFPTALALTYNSNAQTLITAGEGTGVMLYKLGNGEWSENLPQATNAGTYTIYYKSSESKKYKESAEYSIETSVAKVTPNLVVPTPKVLTYNTKAQELVVAGSTDWGTLKYSLDNTNWGTEIPKAKNAGVYTLYYRVDGDDNINSIAADSILAPIAEKRVTDPTIVLSQDNYTYNGSACEPTPTVYDGSVIIPSEEYTVSYANNVNAGTATVIISDVVDGNYYVIGTTTFAIAKANASCTAPTAKSGLVYSGSVQSLVNAGTASGGTMHYSLDNENWSTDIPTATNAGSYTIYYKVVGDANHNDIAAASVSNSIAKANCTYTVPTAATNLSYTGEAQNLLVAGTASGGTMQYSSDGTNWSTTIPQGTNAGSYTSYWRIVGDSNHNDKASATLSTSVAKAERVVYSMTLLELRDMYTCPQRGHSYEIDVNIDPEKYRGTAQIQIIDPYNGTHPNGSLNGNILTISENAKSMYNPTFVIELKIAEETNYQSASMAYALNYYRN